MSNDNKTQINFKTKSLPTFATELPPKMNGQLAEFSIILYARIFDGWERDAYYVEVWVLINVNTQAAINSQESFAV